MRSSASCISERTFALSCGPTAKLILRALENKLIPWSAQFVVCRDLVLDNSPTATARLRWRCHCATLHSSRGWCSRDTRTTTVATLMTKLVRLGSILRCRLKLDRTDMPAASLMIERDPERRSAPTGLAFMKLNVCSHHRCTLWDMARAAAALSSAALLCRRKDRIAFFSARTEGTPYRGASSLPVGPDLLALVSIVATSVDVAALYQYNRSMPDAARQPPAACRTLISSA